MKIPTKEFIKIYKALKELPQEQPDTYFLTLYADGFENINKNCCYSTLSSAILASLSLTIDEEYSSLPCDAWVVINRWVDGSVVAMVDFGEISFDQKEIEDRMEALR